ncbi:MAG: hypothetical protein ACOYYF_08940 [Chloroflexota bacterium]
MKKSPVRQLIRALRFLLNVWVLVSAVRGDLAWYKAALLYIVAWVVYIAVDASIAYRMQKAATGSRP